MSDNVNHPDHYNGFSNGSEVVDIAEHLSFNLGNAVKYIARAGKKDPAKHVEDLEKSRWYLNREIDRLTRTTNEHGAMSTVNVFPGLNEIHSKEWSFKGYADNA